MREPFILSESRKTFNLLFARISAELDIGNDVWIEVVAPNELATNIG